MSNINLKVRPMIEEEYGEWQGFWISETSVIEHNGEYYGLPDKEIPLLVLILGFTVALCTLLYTLWRFGNWLEKKTRP